MKLLEWWLVLFLINNVRSAKTSSEWEHIKNEEDVSEETQQVEAVLGKTTSLPCDIESKDRQNVVYMVLWFRQNGDKPIYRFDARGRTAGKELHWSDERSLGPRAYFVTLSRPASLQLDNVQLRDEGAYRCRVDYRNAPTKNFQIHLTVIVPPHQIILYDNSGREIQKMAGPFYEGDDLVLICEVRGGKPAPWITWTSNGKNIKNRTKSVESNVVISKLEIKNLTRSNHNNFYSCVAANSKLTVPAEKSLQLKLNLKPASVNILKKYKEMIADRMYSLTCESKGSSPPAVITWWKDEALLNVTKTYQNTTDEATTNVISLLAKPEDNNLIIRCQAFNPKVDLSSIEDSFQLNILYPPVVFLQLGNKLDSDEIKESDDVYFECKHHANPASNKIQWYRDNTRIFQNVSSGIILSGQSLVLQSITRNYSGSYTCCVSNTEGDVTSNAVILRVKYAPICESANTTLLGSSLGEVVHIDCAVISDPSVISFKWIFNNSAQTSLVPKEKFIVMNSNVSRLEYKLTSHRDFGTLTCWARNSIGEQTRPCTFFVIPAVRPNVVTNCTFHTITKENTQLLEIRCVPGYNGGLSQNFHLEINRQNRTIANLSSISLPEFRIELSKVIEEWQSDLRFIVYSSNTKGRSEAVVLEHTIPKDLQIKMVAELTMSEKDKNGNEYAALSVIMAFIFALIIVATLFAIVVIKKLCSPRNSSSEIELKKNAEIPKKENGLVIKNFGSSKPDILNKVADRNSLKLQENEAEIVSSHSPRSSIMRAWTPQRSTLSKIKVQSPDTEKKVASFVTTFMAKSETKVTCKKIENISSTKLTDAIFGPESAV